MRRTRNGVDDIALHHGLHVLAAPVWRRRPQQFLKIRGIGNQFSRRLGSGRTDAGGGDEELAGLRVQESSHNAIIDRVPLFRIVLRRPQPTAADLLLYTHVVEKFKMQTGSHLHGPAVVEGSENDRRRGAEIFERIAVADSDLARLAHANQKIRNLHRGKGIAAGYAVARINLHIAPGDPLRGIEGKDFVVALGLGLERARMTAGIALVDFVRWPVDYGLCQTDDDRLRGLKDRRPKRVEGGHRVLALAQTEHRADNREDEEQGDDAENPRPFMVTHRLRDLVQLGRVGGDSFLWRSGDGGMMNSVAV